MVVKVNGVEVNKQFLVEVDLETAVKTLHFLPKKEVEKAWKAEQPPKGKSKTSK